MVWQYPQAFCAPEIRIGKKELHPNILEPRNSSQTKLMLSWIILPAEGTTYNTMTLLFCIRAELNDVNISIS